VQVMTARQPHRRRRWGLSVWLVLFLLSALVSAGYVAYERLLPNRDRIVPAYETAHPLVFRGELQSRGAVVDGVEVLLPIDTVREALAPENPIRHEAESGTIVLTTADKVVRLKTDALTATVNRKPYSLQVAATMKDGVVHIPMTPLRELFGLQAEVAEGTGVVTLLQPGVPVQRGQADARGTLIRTEPTIRAPIAAEAAPGTTVRIWGEKDGWYAVQSAEGHLGYAAKSALKLAEPELVKPAETEPPYIAWKLMGRKVNMTWEAVYEENPDPAKIGPLPGVNVVSPTWLHLIDDNGRIKSKADPNYVAWARKRGYQIWALFGNGFEPDRTSAALASYEKRFYMIQQLLTYADAYKLNGINIDFENVYTKDKDNLVQFVREFVPLAHEQGLVVSIDVTPKSATEMWSLFLDRRELAKTVDFMMLMAYDEHWATSPKAGSVASLPWTENAVLRLLEEDEVDPRKLILGMPLYTRIWTETAGEDGRVKVKSKAVGMTKVEEILRTKKLAPAVDPDAGQHYVEYKENGALNRIWIEDELSVKARLALVKKYDLGGIATWQRTFQKPSIWETIGKELGTHP